MKIPPLFANLCDNAALFPPGNAPLADAVPAHAEHVGSDHAALVGPFVFPIPRLDELPAVLARHDGTLQLSLTAPGGTATVTLALDRLRALDEVTATAIEIAVPADQSIDELLPALDEIAAAAPDVDLFVEIPRDHRRPVLLDRLAQTRYAAKFRTGGTVASAYPDETELAAAIHAAVEHQVAFKATAGLHHAVRNTDPDTGFEQHGFLNLMLATHQAAGGAPAATLAETLAERDGALLAAALESLPAESATALRRRFRSFGTCSISDPLTELVGLGLLPRPSTSIEEGHFA